MASKKPRYDTEQIFLGIFQQHFLNGESIQISLFNGLIDFMLYLKRGN